MSKIKILLCVVCLPLIIYAQQTENGIKWTTGLSWEQVKEKAKKENKHIFLDCFTTWCGPCKMMDAQIYSNDSVGDYFNTHFISVRVQMDKTKNDNEQVQRWYDDAAEVSKKYQVEAYPTLLYFSPQGILTDKQIGTNLEITKFINNANAAIVPGKVYSDPQAKNKQVLADYKAGVLVNKDSLVRLIKFAASIKDSILNKLIAEHISYVSGLDKEKRYTVKNIRFWADANPSLLLTKSELVDFFYKDAKYIDKVMNQEGFAFNALDKKYILEKISIPFLEKYNPHPDIALQGYYTAISATYTDELDWNKLKSIIKKQFNNKLTEMAVLTARIVWYKRNKNFKAFAKYGFIRTEKYTPKVVSSSDANDIDQYAWYTFLYITNKDSLNNAIFWTEYALKQHPKSDILLDTYANLLYKVGRLDEAIEWEEKALAIAPGDLGIQDALKNMKEGKPTYVYQGAIW